MDFILENDKTVVTLDPDHGGRIASILIDDQELLISKKEDPLAWGCYAMAPWVGRTKNGEFSFNKKTHQLPINFPPHSIHGTTFYRPWQYLGHGVSEIDLGDDWPFAGKAVQKITLEENAINLNLELYCDEGSFPASIGWHPWFNKFINGNEAILDFAPSQKYLRDDFDIPTGDLVDPGASPWDDCFVGVIRAPRITWPDFISLDIISDASHWVVYNQPEDSLCVEPQTGPANGLNIEPKIIKSDAPLSLKTQFRWSAA